MKEDYKDKFGNKGFPEGDNVFKKERTNEGNKDENGYGSVPLGHAESMAGNQGFPSEEAEFRSDAGFMTGDSNDPVPGRKNRYTTAEPKQPGSGTEKGKEMGDG